MRQDLALSWAGGTQVCSSHQDPPALAWAWASVGSEGAGAWCGGRTDPDGSWSAAEPWQGHKSQTAPVTLSCPSEGSSVIALG